MAAEQLGTTGRIAFVRCSQALCFVATGGTMAFALLFVTGDLARARTRLWALGAAVLGAFALALVVLMVLDRQRLASKVALDLALEGWWPPRARQAPADPRRVTG